MIWALSKSRDGPVMAVVMENIYKSSFGVGKCPIYGTVTQLKPSYIPLFDQKCVLY